MSSMQHVEGVIILGLALMGVAVASALRGLYLRSNIPFLVRKPADDASQPSSGPRRSPTPTVRKAA
ncbi:MAG TPA: hypothetical protein VHZ24_15915 [Pirellulales bacterium]|jgi:hypothetical protein|nr:hypothetical protein [Pirellulales bacterium]